MAGEEKAYAALGLRPGATRAQVDEAYRRLIKLHHPDMAGGDPGRAAEINRAYGLLRRQGKAVSVRPRRRPPVPVERRSPPRGRKAGLALAGIVAIAAAVGLASEEGDLGQRRAGTPAPMKWAQSALPGRSDEPPLSGFEEPVQDAVIARAVADALKFHAAADREAASEYSRACHERLRSDPSLTWFDSCVAFDEAVVTLGGGDVPESGRFDAASVTARQMGAARLLSRDTLAADARLRQIRSRVELSLLPGLDRAPDLAP